MTLSLAPAVSLSLALADVNALRLAVNRLVRNAPKRWKSIDPHAVSLALTAFRALSRRLTVVDGRCPAHVALTDAHYSPLVVDAMADLRSRIAHVESGVALHVASVRNLAGVADRVTVAIIGGSADHGPVMPPHDAGPTVRMAAMAARIAWLDDRCNDALDEEEDNLYSWFARERDSLMGELAFYGSEHLRAAGLRSDGMRRAENRIPGLDD